MSHATTADVLGAPFVLPVRDRSAAGESAGATSVETHQTPPTAAERRAAAAAARESEWVEAAKRGSTVAFEEIVRRYQRPIFSLIVRKVRDPALAEDLAQETFIKAYRALSTFDQSRRLASWLFKIAHNTAIDHLRRRRLPVEALESDDDQRAWIDTVEDEATLSADRAVEGRQLGRELVEALGRLRPDYREVLVLRFVEGLSYLEVADVTDQPLGTVKTKIHRARRELAELITQH